MDVSTILTSILVSTPAAILTIVIPIIKDFYEHAFARRKILNQLMFLSNKFSNFIEKIANLEKRKNQLYLKFIIVLSFSIVEAISFFVLFFRISIYFSVYETGALIDVGSVLFLFYAKYLPLKDNIYKAIDEKFRQTLLNKINIKIIYDNQVFENPKIMSLGKWLVINDGKFNYELDWNKVKLVGVSDKK